MEDGRKQIVVIIHVILHSTNCPIITMDNKDLVDALNEWVNDNAPTLYRKWIYKKNSEGKVYPAME